jgi:hypothetical protein
MDTKGAQRAVLVTGTPRSGTTWVGKMICLSSETLEVFEPFVPRNYNSLTIQPHPFDVSFPFIRDNCQANRYRPFIESALGLRFDYSRESENVRSVRDFLRMGRRWVRTNWGRVKHLRIVQKDPHALLSAPWLADEYRMQVIVTIRHPAAYVHSIQKNGWRYPLQEFANIEPLLDGPWAEFADDLLEYNRKKISIVDEAILMWLCLTSLILTYQEKYPYWLYVKHEALCLDPVGGFRAIYKHLCLDYSKSIDRAVRFYSSRKNPKSSIYHDVRRDSRDAARAWMRELPQTTIEHIRKRTAFMANRIYSEDNWP